MRTTQHRVKESPIYALQMTVHDIRWPMLNILEIQCYHYILAVFSCFNNLSMGVWQRHHKFLTRTGRIVISHETQSPTDQEQSDHVLKTRYADRVGQKRKRQENAKGVATTKTERNLRRIVIRTKI